MTAAPMSSRLSQPARCCCSKSEAHATLTRRTMTAHPVLHCLRARATPTSPTWLARLMGRACLDFTGWCFLTRILTTA
ncbi:hypothetical protein AcW1_009400 [Taiwanofungus camphoratus]|nr:hypothetical protein AcW1_009400 [Antrodia cinnamomea]